MYLCQIGYPCVYLRRIDDARGTCLLPTCQIELNGDVVTDKMTGKRTQFVRRVSKRKSEKETRTDTIGNRSLHQAMSDVDTYERRHGRVRQKYSSNR